MRYLVYFGGFEKKFASRGVGGFLFFACPESRKEKGENCEN